MSPRPLPAALVALLCVFALASPSRSAAFDLIYTDHVDLTLPESGVGMTLADFGFGLVINKGATDIGAAEFFATEFTVVSSCPEMALWPFVNDPGIAVAPIHPNEAVGSVQAPNSVLTSLLVPGETLRNTQPLQVIAFMIERTWPGAYVGPVSFAVTMTMGDAVAHFTIHADVLPSESGEFAISFPSAARVSSESTTTPAATNTWGALKALYR
jgi:hypothetical protein